MLALQLLFDALVLGASYTLAALGFVLVLNASGAVNFAHGNLVMAGGLGAAVLGRALGWSGLAVLPLVLAASAGTGALLAVAAVLPVRRRPPEVAFVTTIAAGIVLAQGANLLAGPEPRAAPALAPGLADGDVWHVAGLVLPVQSVLVLLVAAGCTLALHLALRHTQGGRRLRAAAQDPEMAAAVGIPVTRTLVGTFAVGAALAGTAGLLLSHGFFVSPDSGGDYMLKAYAAAVLGGWGSLPGAAVGAFLLAALEVIYPALPALLPVLAHAPGDLFSGAASAAVADAAVLLVLWRRPTGLFGEAVQFRT